MYLLDIKDKILTPLLPVFEKEFFIITKTEQTTPGHKNVMWDLKLSEIPFYHSIHKLNLTSFVINLGLINKVKLIVHCNAQMMSSICIPHIIVV